MPDRSSKSKTSSAASIGVADDDVRRARAYESGVRPCFVLERQPPLAAIVDANALLRNAVDPARAFPSLVAILERVVPLRAAAFVSRDDHERPIVWFLDPRERAQAEAEAIATAARAYIALGDSISHAARTAWRWLTFPVVSSAARVVGIFGIVAAADAIDEAALAVIAGIAPLLARFFDSPSAHGSYSVLTSQLYASLDYRASLARTARLLAATPGTGCVVELDGDPPLQIVHVPGLDERAVVDAITPVILAVMATGVPMHATSMIGEAAARRLGIASLRSVPIRGDGEPIGTLTVLNGRDDLVPQLGDRQLAELGRCMATAVENGRLYERALEGLRTRDEILSIVSHDLKNPLAVILMSASRMLERSSKITDRGRHVETIHRSAHRMRRLVSDLLDAAAIESGSVKIEPAPCSINVLVREAIVAASDSAAAARVTLRDELGELPPALADSERVLQVLGNLLANAIKFTRPRGLVVVRAEAHDDIVAVHVEDSGVGIDPSELPHIFDRFWRARRTHRSGTGLGLAICKSLVERSGGTISATSTVGVGTTLTFTLPRAP
jgi:signal transduction histidine kinase